ncbi:MAG: DUF309 domain-containing protein [Nitrososphaerota archaeon]|nr:DUF309 domain-containing protein [Nitrososphaerota archaeon]
MRFLVRLKSKREGGAVFLALVKSLAESVMAEARNPKWTSYGALEIDIFAPTAEDFELFLAAVGPMAETEFSKNLSEAPPYKPKEALVDEARGYFNSERYWEAHETLESVWRAAAGDEKSYLQGLILVCAAFVHHQKREETVALGVLRRASRQLSYGANHYFGIRVDALKKNVDGILAAGRFEVFTV